MRGTFIPQFEVTGISDDGRAFGMFGDIRVFVEKGVPGDVADIYMIKSKRAGMIQGHGRIAALQKRSSIRIEPFCRHFSDCGGCQWQNISYADQLKIKQEQVDRLFPVEIFGHHEKRAILPSSLQTRFRNRVTFTFSNRRWMMPEEAADPFFDKRPAGGYVLKGKNDRILNITECFLADDFAVRLMHALREKALSLGYSFFDVRHETGFLRQLIVRFGSADDILVTVVFGENNPEQINSIMSYLAESFPEITSLYWVLNERKRGISLEKPHNHFSGSKTIAYSMESLVFTLGPNSFYQTNTLQAYELYKTARAFAALTGSETVYDLYTGTGTLALFVSGQCKKVTGIDNVQEAIDDAGKNAMANGVMNASFLAGDIKDALTADLFRDHGSPDVIFTDPPRAGMHREGIRNLLSSGAKRMVYISCNPVTQSRDVKQLLSKYSLVAYQPVDMFPQTGHVENVMLLELRAK